jgi:Ca2+-binding EF-hand superfamily protein
MDELGNVFETIGSALQQDELEDVMSDIDDSGDGEVRTPLRISFCSVGCAHQVMNAGRLTSRSFAHG